MSSYIASVLIFVSILLLSYSAPLDLFPFNETYFEFSTVADSVNAEAELDNSHGHLHFRYTLFSNDTQPMLLFHAQKLARTINLSKFDQLVIETDPQDNTDFMVTLYMFVPGFSDPTDMRTHRPYSFLCRANEKHSSFKLNLEDFATPTNWFTLMNVHEKKLPATDWSRMTHMALTAYSGAPLNTTLQTAFTKIQFVAPILPRILFAGTVTVIILVLQIILHHAFKKRKTKQVKERIYGKHNELVTEEESNRLFSYIENNFGDPYFSLEKIEHDLKQNPYQVNLIIRNTHDIGYKQYLNQIRIEEAKHLLRNTDFAISAIGQRVGYLHSNSFARMFRNIEGIAPNEYRRNNPE